MNWRSRPEAWGAGLLVAVAAVPTSAQAQRGWHETQLWGVATASRPAIVAGGLGLAWRDRGRTRVGAALAAGATDDGRAAGRFEVSWHFLLDPARRSGLAVYGGGGAALSAAEHSRVRPWVQVVLGIETSPAARHGFFVEGGFGGGARGALGVRLRSPRR